MFATRAVYSFCRLQKALHCGLLGSAALILMTSAGCTKKVDTSTDENWHASVEAIDASLDDEQKKEFHEALELVTSAELGAAIMGEISPEKMKANVEAKVNGKTAKEIIAIGNDIRRHQKQEERKQVLSEISEIEAKLAELAQQIEVVTEARKQLAMFEVIRARFYYSKNDYRVEPVIELTLRNGTQCAVARAHFQATLATPGRSVPWIQDTFNYKISGGLEPGEQATWKLSPNAFGEWGKAPKDRNDMVLTVLATRIDGTNGEPILNATLPDQVLDNQQQLNERHNELRQNLAQLTQDLL